MGEADLRFIITNKAHVYQGTVVAKHAEVNLNWNTTSVATFVVDDDHRMLNAMATDGARCRVMLNGVQEMSGLIESVKGTFPDGEVTVTAMSDFEALRYVLGWQVPTAAITAQASEYRTYSGVSETVAKNAISEANTRLGLGWTVTATGGKGTATRVEFRMHPLFDKILEPLIIDKLQLRIDRSEAGAVTVDVTQGTTVPRTLTLASGVLDEGNWERRIPTATRVVVGGRGEAVDRVFAAYVDSARETAWGMKREVFRDARNTDVGADLSIDGNKALADGDVKSSLSTTLNEQSWFQYRAGYVLGDIVTINVGPVTVSDVISRVAITETLGEGIKVVPSVGDINDSGDKKLAAAIGKLARGVRDQGRR